ncbi:uncharacterized protein V2V93DRAFT_375069 [Kockiozyma suomiensis]|uniref:uncharacterized protein n=1 Tax=Kockiozyma suomiensis TaxID=1337062 RepID=UPI003343CC64
MFAPEYSESDHGVLQLSNVISTLHTALASRSSISSPSEFLALLCHASMLSVGFEHLGNADESSSTEGPEFSASASQFTFRYRHSQSALSPFLLSAAKLGPKLIISALSEGNDDQTHSFEVRMSELVPQTISFPLALGDSTIPIGFDRIALQAFITAFKKTIIQGLIPNLQKEGYTEDRSATTSAPREIDSFNNQPPPPYPDSSTSSRDQPLRPSHPDFAQPRRPSFPDHIPRNPLAPPLTTGPPGFEDEYEILSGPRSGLQGDIDGRGDFRSPFSIGDDDLYPPGLGPHPSMTPGLTSPFSGGGSRGMYPSADHPLFAGRSGRGSSSGVGGIRPPGARWDPPMDPAGEDPDMMGIGGGLRMPGAGGSGRFPGAGGLGGRGGMGGGFGNGFGGFGGGGGYI